jgi:hypothetical protein
MNNTSQVAAAQDGVVSGAPVFSRVDMVSAVTVFWSTACVGDAVPQCKSMSSQQSPLLGCRQRLSQ